MNADRPRPPESVTVRTERPGEREAVRAVVTAAFADDGAIARLVDALDASPDRLDGLSLVAVAGQDDGASADVVGHVMGTRAYLDTRRELREVVVLSPLSVAPESQGRGIGGALIEALVEAAAGAGHPAVVLEGDPGYYARHQFAAAEPLGFRRPSLRIPGPAFQARLLPAHEDWMTGTVVYPRVFWDHDAVGLRDPDLANVEAALGE